MTPQQKEGIALGHIRPLKGQFLRTQSQEMIGSALYKSLQRAIGQEGEYFLENAERFDSAQNSHQKREIYNTLVSYIAIDPNKLPPKFIELFGLDVANPDIDTQVKHIFNRAHYLNKESGRVIFIDGKVIIFKNQVRLVHIDTSRALTAGEKRRYTIYTTFNTFETLYDAIRSQHRALYTIKMDKDTVVGLTQDVLELTHDIKTEGFGAKDKGFTRRLNDIIGKLGTVTDYKKLAALLYNLEQLRFKNTSIDVHLLQGASHKLTNRFDNLTNMIDIIAYRDLPKLEQLLQQHKNALDMFLTQINYIKDKDYVFEQYQERIGIIKKNTLHRINSIIPDQIYIEPFGNIYKIINMMHDKYVLGDMKYIEILKSIYDTYDNEHNQKMEFIDKHLKT